MQDGRILHLVQKDTVRGNLALVALRPETKTYESICDFGISAMQVSEDHENTRILVESLRKFQRKPDPTEEEVKRVFRMIDDEFGDQRFAYEGQVNELG